MSRDSEQIVRLVETLFRRLRGRVPLVWVGVLAALLVGYLIAQPHLERSLGMRLPGLASGSPAGVDDAREGRPPSPPIEPSGASPPSILHDLGRGVYESPAGVRYTRGSQHGHRFNHVMAHTRDEPDRPYKHGVFNTNDPIELVQLIDEAFEQAESGQHTRSRKEEGRDVHVVDLGRRIGYIGGEWGASHGRPAATRVQLVLQGSNLITAYPVLK